MTADAGVPPRCPRRSGPRTWRERGFVRGRVRSSSPAPAPSQAVIREESGSRGWHGSTSRPCTQGGRAQRASPGCARTGWRCRVAEQALGCLVAPADRRWLFRSTEEAPWSADIGGSAAGAASAGVRVAEDTRPARRGWTSFTAHIGRPCCCGPAEAISASVRARTLRLRAVPRAAAVSDRRIRAARYGRVRGVSRASGSLSRQEMSAARRAPLQAPSPWSAHASPNESPDCRRRCPVLSADREPPRQPGAHELRPPSSPRSQPDHEAGLPSPAAASGISGWLRHAPLGRRPEQRYEQASRARSRRCTDQRLEQGQPRTPAATVTRLGTYPRASEPQARHASALPVPHMQRPSAPATPSLARQLPG